MRRIMAFTEAITRSARQPVKRRAGRGMSNHKTLFSTRHQQRTERRGTGHAPPVKYRSFSLSPNGQYRACCVGNDRMGCGRSQVSGGGWVRSKLGAEHD